MKNSAPRFHKFGRKAPAAPVLALALAALTGSAAALPAQPAPTQPTGPAAAPAAPVFARGVAAGAARYRMQDLGPAAPLGLDAHGRALVAPMPATLPAAGGIGGGFAGMGGFGPPLLAAGPVLPEGVLWDDQWLTPIADLNPTAMSPAGLIAGQDYAGHAALRYNGRVRDLGTLGGSESTATAINDVGHVVGQCVVGGEVPYSAAFLWRAGVLVNLGRLPGDSGSAANAINRKDRVVGYSYLVSPSGSVQRAVLWDNGAIRPLGTLGGANSIAYAVNDRGWVVGRSETAANDAQGRPLMRAFLWNGTEMRALAGEPGRPSWAYSINARAVVVGAVVAADGYTHATVWDGGPATDLNTLIGPDSPWALEEARFVGDSGAILCSAFLRAGSQAHHAILLLPLAGGDGRG